MRIEYKTLRCKVGAALVRSRDAKSSVTSRRLYRCHVNQDCHDVARHVLQEGVGADHESMRWACCS